MRMNITFLVGNGFDLAANLNTSYKKFYDWYCNNNSSHDKEDNETVKKFKLTILDDGNNWADLELGLGRYTKEFKETEIEQYMECYEDVHYAMISFIKAAENQYKETLITDEAIDSFCDGIANFYQELIPTQVKIIDNTLKINDSVVVNFVSFNYTNILDRYIKAATSKKSIIKEWPYKNTMHSMKINPSVLHIHGLTDYYPVLGVGEEKDVANQAFLKNSSINCSLIKRSSIDSIGEAWYTTTSSLIDKSSIICIWGMSLGQSDAPWWKEIMRWLAKRSDHHLIVFWHSNNPQDTISFKNRNDEIESVKELLMKYSSASPDHKSSIKNQIYVIINTMSVLTIPPISKSSV